MDDRRSDDGRWTLVDPSYEPTEDDWEEFASWSRSLDAGCGERELTSEEMDLLAASVADFEYREALQDLESFLADRYFGGVAIMSIDRDS